MKGKAGSLVAIDCSNRLSSESQLGRTRHSGSNNAQAGINKSPIIVAAQTKCRVADEAWTNARLVTVAIASSTMLLQEASKSDRHKKPEVLEPRIVTLNNVKQEIFFIAKAHFILKGTIAKLYFCGVFFF